MRWGCLKGGLNRRRKITALSNYFLGTTWGRLLYCSFNQMQKKNEEVQPEALSWNVYTGYLFFIVGGAVCGKGFIDSLEAVCFTDLDLNEQLLNVCFCC